MGDSFPMEQLLPPSLDSMLRFLRLDPAEILLERVAERLLDDVGLTETLWRLSSLPVPLPLCLITAARALSQAELRQLVRAWARRPPSQLSMLH